MPKNIVIVHGWDSSTTKFKSLEKHLKNSGWSVLLLKLPFFDLKEPNNPWKLEDFSNYLLTKATINFKHRQFIIFGHSNGGRIAISTQNSPIVTGIILCSTAGISRNSALKRKILKWFSTILSVTKKTKYYNYIRKIPYMLAGNYDYYLINSPTKKKTFQNLISKDLKPAVSKISKPTLILWGREDKLTPIKDAYWLAKNIKISQLEIWDNTGHKLPYEKPKQLAEAIEKWYSTL